MLLQNELLPNELTGRASDSRVWVEIDRQILKSNLNAIRDFVYPCNVMAVVKANAYGLGATSIAQVLAETEVDSFGVAEVSTAMNLRKLGRPVHILGALLDKEIESVVRNECVAPLGSIREAELLSREALRQGRIAMGQIVVDSGMGRLGIQINEAEDVIQSIASLPALRIVGLYSHFPCASHDDSFSRRQVEDVSRLLKRNCVKNLALKWRHIANSEGVQQIAQARLAPFNLVRVGISLYGLGDLRGELSLDLKPVATLKTRLIAIREMPAGASIGYDRTHTLQHSTRVGTLSAGYADGLPMGLGGRGHIIYKDRRCPMVGKLSMDFSTVDLANAPDAKVGDEVTLADGREILAWSDLTGLPAYNLMCSLGSRVNRIYL